MTYRHFHNESTRSSVIKAVADTGNEPAWERMFDLYAGYIFSIARSKGMKPEDADDIVQTVFTDLARNLKTFQYDRTKGKFRSYLTGLVHWRIKDKLREGKRNSDLKDVLRNEIETTGVPANDDFTEREWQQAALDEALRRIKQDVKPEHYAVFVASMIEGQDTETIMRLYGLGRDNIYQIRKRLGEKLRQTVNSVLSDMDSPLESRLDIAGL